MKKLLFFFALLATLQLQAQNKTLGVGTTTPNTNAALHVESPTNNQGFIMPRLTTAQRNAMGSLLTANDQGLMLYDTDLKTIYIWDGAKWNTSAQVAGGARLSFPYRDSVTTALTQPMINLVYNNPDAAPMFYLQRYDTTSVTNPFVVEQNGKGAAVVIRQNAKLGTGFISQLSNAANPQPAVRGITVGTGAGIQGVHNGTVNGFAGLFSVNQAANTYPAVQANSKGPGSAFRAFQSPTDGIGPGVDVFMQNTSSTAGGVVVNATHAGEGVTVNMNNATSAAAGIKINYTGTGNAIQTGGKIQAGQFIGDGSGLTNLPAVSFPFATSLSAGTTLFDVTNTGTASAGRFKIANNANTAHALYAESNADTLGAAIHGSNIGNGFGVYGKSAGTKFASAAVYGEHVGTGDAAGAFRISNAGNPYSSLYGETNGTGPAVYGKQITSASNANAHAAYFQQGDATHTTGLGAAVFGVQLGLARAGQFQINNTANTNAALRAFTDGTGRSGFFTINNATNASEGLYSNTNGTGNAGKFEITNAASTAYALVGESNGGLLGAGVYGNNTGGGFGVYAKASNGTALGSAAVYGEQLGSGDAAGAFRINNSTNTKAALYGETNSNAAGAAAIRAENIGAGNGAYIKKTGGTKISAALWADNFGVDGYGAIIQNASTSPEAALFAEAVGIGPSILASKTSPETGNALEAVHSGNGGYAIYANSSVAADVIYAEKKAGDGTGSAGNFNNAEPSNPASTLFAMTNSASGPAIGALNSASGIAIAMFQGGFQLASLTVSSGGGSISQRAGLYEITVAGTYSLPTGGSAGETCWVYATSTSTVEGVSITGGVIRQFIRLSGGAWKAVN